MLKRNAFGSRFMLASTTVAAIAGAAHGDIILTSGSISLAASWTGGDPVLPDPSIVHSGQSTVNWTAGAGYTFLYLPLITPGVHDEFVGEGKISAKSGIGGLFNDVRLHRFTFTAIHSINFLVTEDMTYTRSLWPAGELLGPFDLATIRNTDTGSTPIDLLANATGFVSPGNYEIQLLVTQEWETDLQSISFHMDFFIDFDPVPSPGSVTLLGVSSLAVARRRRT